MIKLSLREFNDRVRAKGRIGKNDVRLLRRDLLGDGVASRDEAELLLGLDRAVATVHPSWTTWLVSAVVDLAVWGAHPTGYVDADIACWLVAALAGEDGVPTHRGLRIAREICREAQGCDPRLAALAPGEAEPGPLPMPAAPESLAA